MSRGKIFSPSLVPVAQWIEYWPPEPVVRVRISPGTFFKPYRDYLINSSNR